MTAPAGSLRPPTSLAGYVTDDLYYGTLRDVLEHVPDLIYPLSIPTYGKMRREPALAAVLAAYTLPLRRATWAIDPTGCRDEVVQVVADDLGLPIVGVDRPGAARTRGVSWAEHLRQALSHLTFGHSAFEMLAEIRDGRARLVGLFERLQTTIQEIHVDQQGRLVGISQDFTPNRKAPQIPASRVVWYAHEPEGAALHGNSLLRPSFGYWLIKQELVRVAATSHRRFGMGVPTVEWATGANPSPAQMAEAQRAASAARVGDQSGLTLPPGATLILKGLTGSAPDSIALLRYVDQQMSRSVLAGFLDLGVSETGSRALAESFIDLFTLSIGAVGSEVADLATRQLSARIVEWNWGDSEPVPAVTVADVGTKQEITAEALDMLMRAGAITPDPALEAYVRRSYRLPAQEQDSAPPAPGDTVAAANGQVRPQAQPVTAGSSPRRRSRREPPDGQMELPIAAASDAPSRDLTADEIAAGVDFQQIQADHDTAVAALVAAMPALLAPIAAGLVAEVSADLASGAVSALGSLTPDITAVTALGDAIAGQSTKLAADSAWLAGVEVDRIGLPVSDVTVDDAALAERARATAQIVATGLAQAASRTALLHNGPGVAAQTVIDAVQADLDEIVQNERNWITGSLSACMHTAQALGRMAAFETLAEAYGEDSVVLVASEVNDRSVCPNCHDVDGKRFPSFAEAIATYPAGQMITCAGRERCRGHLFAARA